MLNTRIASTRDDRSDLWQWLVVQGRARRMRHTFAASYIRIRDCIEHDALAHAQDLLCLHRALQDVNQQALDRDASRAQCMVGVWRRQHERGVCSAAMLAW